MTLRITASGLSDKGKVRPKNEDTMAVDASRGLLVVADGMGGAPAGEVASGLAVQEFEKGIDSGLGMRESVLRANAKVLEMAASQDSLRGMGTTLTALRLDADTGGFEIGHVGDSRAYRLHDGTLWQLTRDHSASEEMVEQGALSPQQALTHPMRHILSRAVGTREEVEVDIILGLAGSGDRFLLCSDGLVRVFQDQELEERMVGWDGKGLDQWVRGLVEEANRRGSPDNVTVAVLATD